MDGSTTRAVRGEAEQRSRLIAPRGGPAGIGPPRWWLAAGAVGAVIDAWVLLLAAEWITIIAC